MSNVDLVGLLLFGCFGLWWICLPGSVHRFFGWFHRGKVKLPSENGIRLAGAIWLVVVFGIVVAKAAR